ncbi:PAS domain S-box-containing protein [Mariprofundus ferrinatatus]|uniref:histidine kinase n=1 Tax=Mariprofundus ferrinatatus TaxID=1921087 RepID=A0A2K8LC59_9PROT|nr:MHYT domain-containing protein [Mariprofundus ferrinatatus]ATX82484.1 PAS domain S-box-containing protein [Mariprofundus ferrinatatus]
MEILGTYNWLLVVVSVMAAMGASFVALATVPRIYASSSNKQSLAWVATFGLSLGAGIWTMHFIAILALQMPIPVQFDIALTAMSLLLAVVVSAIAIYPLHSGVGLSPSSPTTYLIGTVMGLGIAGMHYSGMAAIRLNATMHHDHSIVILAIVIAIVASTAALLIANRLRDSRIFSQLGTKSAAAVVMGTAVSAMHYTAMEGMTFFERAEKLHFEATIDPLILAIFILIVAFLVQGTIIIIALFDEAYSISEKAAVAMKQRADINHSLSKILSLALENLTLSETLDKVLDEILEIEWLALDKKGSIFLADDKKSELTMIAKRNLGDQLLSLCSSVEYGRCLCGMAAEQKALIFKPSLDAEHTTRTHEMENHGHYCVPILRPAGLLGVINLYVQPGHKPNEEESTFLTAVADAIANIIQNKQLESQADKIFKAIDQAGEAVLITDYDGVIEYVNQAFCSNTGYSEDEVIGKTPALLNSGNQDDEFYENMWKTIKSGEVWQGEIIEKRKDGSFYPAMLTISPIRNNSGEITHFVGIHEDLSEHKTLEAQFRQAQKMEALGTLVGGIAHDFNNMLAGMIGNLFMVKKKMHGMPEMKEKIEDVEKVGFQAAEMIKQMMVFARSEEVEMSPISLTSFIKEAFKLHQIVIPENIKLNKQISSHEMVIVANPTQLQQLILNLFGNAVDAVRKVKDPAISFQIEQIEADQSFCTKHLDAKVGRYAHILLCDNGQGIKKAHLDRIFDPFFTTKEVGKGTGLGLSMSMSIVKSHHGFIEVKSNPGFGTEFHIYLPLSDEKEVARKIGISSKAAEGHGEIILVVDDDSHLRHTTAEALEMLGYKTMMAENGREAVELCKSIKVDLILLDVVMPEVGGPDAAREILARDPMAKIIFATGYDKADSLQSLQGIESIPVLSKPFRIQELSSTIRLLLD